MPNDDILRDGRRHVLGTFNYPGHLWSARHNAPEDIVENALDLTVDQVVDLKLIKAVCLLQLPGAWPTHNDLRLIFFDDRMSNDFEKLGSVKRHQVFAEEFGVNFSRVGNPQRVMRVNRQ